MYWDAVISIRLSVYLESAHPENLPEAHKMADTVICLPMHHALNEEDIKRTLNSIIK